MKQLVNLDNCLSDYFQGCSTRVFIALYDENTTIGDIIGQLEDDAGNGDISEEYDGFNWDELEAAFDRIKDENEYMMHDEYMPNAGFTFDETSSDETPHAFFTLQEVDE